MSVCVFVVRVYVYVCIVLYCVRVWFAQCSACFRNNIRHKWIALNAIIDCDVVCIFVQQRIVYFVRNDRATKPQNKMT